MALPTLIPTTAFTLAQRYLDMAEVAGTVHNPQIVGMLKLDAPWVDDDETAWCSAFANWIAWHLRLPRSKSLAARSWLRIGTMTKLEDAVVGNDVVILARGAGPQPGPDRLDAPGHVGFFAGWDAARSPDTLMILGGNQGNKVSIAPFPVQRVLGIRRLA